MAYSSFSLDEVAEKFALKVREGRLLGGAGSVAPLPWLVDVLARFHPMALFTEQSAREFIVAPILVACRELVDNQVFIYAGPTLNVDADYGVKGRNRRGCESGMRSWPFEKSRSRLPGGTLSCS